MFIVQSIIEQPSAISGGSRVIPQDADHKELFHWPIVTQED